MKLLRQLGIIIGIFLIGEILNKLCNIPIPGNILGMLILFTLLSLNIIKLEMIKEISDFLLSHLAFFFIPPGVALISSLDILSDIWVSFLFIIIVTTIIVMSATGLTVQKIMKRGKK